MTDSNGVVGTSGVSSKESVCDLFREVAEVEVFQFFSFFFISLFTWHYNIILLCFHRNSTWLFPGTLPNP